MLEIDVAASDLNLIIRSIGQVDDLGRYLSGQAEQICRPRPLGHDLPSLPSSNGARRLVNVRAQFPAERRIDLRAIVKAAPDTTNFPIERQLGEGHVNRRST